ncbi:hypothetical protein ACJMK2_031373, partial [Sinanodonta woodiana]
AVYFLIMLGWLFVPVYVACGAYTMPEYLRKRFGGRRIRIYSSVLALVEYILTNISIEIYSGAIFMRLILGWNLYLCVVIILAITALYTVAGGLASVIYTDTLQAVVLIIGAIVVTSLSFIKVGGWNAMEVKYMASAANYSLYNPTFYKCGMPREDALHIFRDPSTGDIPWPGAVFGLTTLGIFVWCQDQIIVQRCLSAKNLSHAKAGSLFGAFLKLTGFLLFVIPGMVSRILYPGVRGLMLAALLAALMSSLTSIFNSASSIVTLDLWKQIRRKATETELMIVGRVTVLVLIGVSILWLPILEASQGGNLWSYFQAIRSYLVPPWCMAFLLAFFWRRTTEQGVFWGLMVGLVVGLIRMVLDFVRSPPVCGSGEEDKRFPIVAKVDFLHFAMILAGVSAIAMVIISIFTQPRPHEKHGGLKQKIKNWLCGTIEETQKNMSADEKAAIRKKMTSINEHSRVRMSLNIAAVLIATFTAFLLGFFG